MDNFRDMERELIRYFRSEGMKSTECGGDVYIGLSSTHVVNLSESGSRVNRYDVRADKYPDGVTVVISVTRLAKHLMEVKA